VREKLWRWTLRKLRVLIDAADDWIHAEEVKIREAAAAPVVRAARPPIEFDRQKSAARERIHKQAVRSPRARLPRLQYSSGEWVQK
jgi:hypothetical protein